MASIQIKADRAITACEKCKKRWLEKNNYGDPANSFYMESVEKIKELAEYITKTGTRKLPECEVCGNETIGIGYNNERDCSRFFCKECGDEQEIPFEENEIVEKVTIDHNDFELIGEFL